MLESKDKSKPSCSKAIGQVQLLASALARTGGSSEGCPNFRCYPLQDL